jgi:hypothetical protein
MPAAGGTVPVDPASRRLEEGVAQDEATSHREPAAAAERNARRCTARRYDDPTVPYHADGIWF